jgi:hypothetical protein
MYVSNSETRVPRTRRGGVRDEDRVVDQDRDRHDDRRDHADGEDGVAKVFAADAEARDRVGQERAEEQCQQRRGGAHEHRVAQSLPDRERLLGGLTAKRRVHAGEREDLRVVVQGGRVRQPVRRPRHPLAGVLERGRDHPEDREHDERGPGDEDRVAHDAVAALAAQAAGAGLFGGDVDCERHHAALATLPRATPLRWRMSM